MKKLVYLLMSIALIGCGNQEKETQEQEPVEAHDGHHTKGDGPEYSPYIGDFQADPLPEGYDRPLWGDTHLHSSYSTDAGMIGNILGPEEAYRIARGEEIVASSGYKMRLIRPLDFLVLSDHAENLGLAPMIAESNPVLLENEFGKTLHDLVKAGKGHDAFQKWLKEGVTTNVDPINSKEMNQTAWHREVDFADKYNDPGTFTAMIGFEWTSNGPLEAPGNLHRVVVFKDNADKAKQVIPMSTYDSYDPEDLWAYMANYEATTGGTVLAIAHNGNLSNGIMFPGEVRLNGQPLDKNYVETRAKYEPLYEVTQIKGDGEAHPFLSPNDEFADYGNWDKSDIAGFAPKENWMYEYEYARAALKLGLKLENQLGTNPYKFGMVGSTDAHTSIPATREENFFGKATHLEPSAHRWDEVLIESLTGDSSLSSYSYETIGAGLAAVWSKENTREGIFDAMTRKETYATTGTRIILRMFAGWDYTEEDLNSPNMVDIGYDNGVPMGGDLYAAGEGQAPTFMIRAAKDVDGANLDRVQIIKGWMDAEGNLQERVYDLAVSDGRTINEAGRCETPVGNTVDVANASYTNSIGQMEFKVLWTDPEFDPDQRAFYYTRVLEIPTPTWLAYDAKRFKLDLPNDLNMSGQERAYSSPIWYNPE